MKQNTYQSFLNIFWIKYFKTYTQGRFYSISMRVLKRVGMQMISSPGQSQTLLINPCK